MTSAGGLVPAGEAAELPGALLLSGPGRRGAGRPRPPRRPPGFPTRSPSTWAAPAPTSAWSGAACPSRPRRRAGGGAPRPAAVARHPHHRRRRRLGRPDRSRAARSWSARRAPAPIPGRPATGGAASSPTVTDADLVARPHPGRGRVRRARRARRRGRGAQRWRAAGVDAPRTSIAVVDAAMVAGACGRSRWSGAWTRAVSPWSPSAAPGRCTPAPWPRRSGMAAVVVPPRAGVLSAVGLLAAPRQVDLVRSWPTPGDHGRAGRTPSPRWPPSRAPQAGRRRCAVDRRRRSTAATRARATSSPSPPSTTSRPSTRAATATPGRARRSRWSPCGPRPGAPPAVAAGRPATRARACGGTGPCVVAEPTAPSGCRRAGRPTGRRRRARATRSSARSTRPGCRS